MHWQAVEVLTLIAGVIVASGSLALPDIETSARLSSVAAGLFFVAYAVWAASRSSGIILVPLGAFLAAGVTLFMLYAHYFGERQD